MDSKPYVNIRKVIPIAAIIVVIGSATGYAWYQNGGSLDFSETDYKIVISGSMAGEPRDQYDISTIPVGSMVFIHKVPSGDGAKAFYSSLQVGDVLTFDYTHPVSHEDMVVTHRIISITESGGVYTYTLKGDSIADDPTNGSVQVVTSASGDVIGKVVGVAPWLGQLVVFLSTWTGKFCLIVIPCVILIGSEFLNIVRTIRSNEEDEAEEKRTETSNTSTEDGSVEVTFTDKVERIDVSEDGLFRRSF